MPDGITSIRTVCEEWVTYYHGHLVITITLMCMYVTHII